MAFKKILHNIATDYDNKTFDTGRVIAIGYFASAIIYEGLNIYLSHGGFDVQKYLTGGAAFLAGLGMYVFGDGKGRPETTKGEVKDDSNSPNPGLVKE